MVDDDFSRVERDFGQEVDASGVSGEEVAISLENSRIRDIQASAANNRATDNKGESVQTAQGSGAVFDAVVCRAEREEVAANNRETHNIGDTGESMHAAHYSVTASDAVVCRAEREFSVSAEELCGEEAIANR